MYPIYFLVASSESAIHGKMCCANLFVRSLIFTSFQIPAVIVDFLPTTIAFVIHFLLFEIKLIIYLGLYYLTY